MTIKLTVLSAIGALILGTMLAAMRVAPVPIMRGFGTVYVNIFRNTPLTLIIVFCLVRAVRPCGINLAPESPTFIVDNNFRLAVARPDRLHRRLRLRGAALRDQHRARSGRPRRPARSG